MSNVQSTSCFLYTDASIREGRSYGGFYLHQELPLIDESFVYRIGSLTINDAEFTAILAGLQCAQKFNVSHIQVFSDNATAVDMITKVHRRRSSRCLNRIRPVSWWVPRRITKLITSFDSLTAFHIDRGANWLAHNLIDTTVTEKEDIPNAIPDWRIND